MWYKRLQLQFRHADGDTMSSLVRNAVVRDAVSVHDNHNVLVVRDI